MSGQPVIEMSSRQHVTSPAALPCRIENATDADAAAWDAFLQRTPGANFYQAYGWRQVNSRQFGHDTHYLVARAAAGGDIRGVLPLVLLKSRLFGTILCSMPFVNFGGPCAADADAAQALLARAVSLTHELDADYAELRVLQPVRDDLPTTRHKVSMTIELAPDPDRVWQAFTSKHRTNIRRVYKNDIEVRHGRQELLDDFHRLLSLSWQRLGTPIYRKAYFAEILERFPETTRIFIAYRHDAPVAAAFNGYFKDTVEGMWAGTSPEHQKLQPRQQCRAVQEEMECPCAAALLAVHPERSPDTARAEREQSKIPPGDCAVAAAAAAGDPVAGTPDRALDTLDHAAATFHCARRNTDPVRRARVRGGRPAARPAHGACTRRSYPGALWCPPLPYALVGAGRVGTHLPCAEEPGRRSPAQ